MSLKRLNKRIRLQKLLLNTLLLFVKPTSSVAVSLSQVLDKNIVTKQRIMFNRCNTTLIPSHKKKKLAA